MSPAEQVAKRRGFGPHYGGVTEEFLRGLFRRFLAGGDEEAMDEFVRRTRPRLLAVARTIGAPQDAEDAVQAAYLALIRKRPDADLMAWLVVVVVRTAYRRKAIDRRQTEIARKLALPAAAEDGPASGAAAAERDTLVRRDVARLPAMYRDAIVLHYFEGMATPEIARLLDLGEATVRTRLHRGRALLRGRLPVSGFFVIGWFCRDALALGEIAMKTKTAVVAAVLLFLVATGVAVRHSVAQREPARANGSRGHATAATDPESPAALEHAAPAVAIAEGPRITGTVLGKTGQPVAGARVALFSEPTAFDTVQEWCDAPPAADARAETDDAGRFGFPGGEDAPSRRLLVEAIGYSPAKVEDVNPGDDVVVTLEPGPALSGRVTTLDGAPVAGARVTWWTFAELLPMERSGVTDDKGSYRLEGLPSHWVFQGLEAYAANIRVDAEGYPPLLANAVQPSWREPGDLRMDLILVPGAMLRGRVLNGHTGEPLEGARVTVRSAPVAGRVFTLAETATGKDGIFTIDGLPAEGFHALPNFMTGSEWKAGTARAEKEGFAAAALDLDALEPGAAADIEIRCWPTGRVTGRVVDGRGEAIEGARVTGFSMVQGRRSVLDPAGSYVQTATDARGLFQLAVPAPGTMQVSLYRDRWPGKLVPVEARPGETVALGDIVWDGAKKPAVEVQVVDAAGNPVWNATVRVEGRSGPFSTDREGRARLWTDEPGTGQVEAWHSRLGSRTARAELRTGEPELVRIALDPPHAIEGEVRWEDGSPAADVLVQACGRAGDGANVRSDREGRFVLRRLRAGSFDVTARWYDTLAAPVEATAAGVQAGSRDVALVLPRIERPPTVEVEGTVRSRGTPVLRFDACLYDNARQINAERPGPGRLRFPEVPVGTWKLRVTARGYGQHEETIEIRLGTPTPRVEIELGPAARVHGRAKGAPRGGMMALRREDGFRTTVAFVLPGGSFAFDGVPPGRYRPEFLGLKSLAPPVVAAVEVESGADARFDFELVPGDTVLLGEGTHRVVAADGTVVLEGEAQSIDLPAGEYEIDGKKVTVTAR